MIPLKLHPLFAVYRNALTAFLGFRDVRTFLPGYLDAVFDALRAVAAVPAGVLPRRHWRTLDQWVPVTRFALGSALVTFGLAAALGVPGFFRYAAGYGDVASDAMLQAAGWPVAHPRAEITSQAQAQTVFLSSYFLLFTFLFTTPTGVIASYLAVTGAVRAILVIVDDARGDPLLTMIDALVFRSRRRRRDRHEQLAREREEGPAVPDRIVSGHAAGITGADIVIVASRLKPGWDAGTFIITDENWYRLGTREDRWLPGGLRHFYPLAEINDLEVLRRGIRYDGPSAPAYGRDRQDL
jgi:hypothetical protein